MVVPSNKLVGQLDKRQRTEWKDWAVAKMADIRLKAVPGADITKVIFAEFKWVMDNK
jgi:hypothetical protein